MKHPKGPPLCLGLLLLRTWLGEVVQDSHLVLKLEGLHVFKHLLNSWRTFKLFCGGKELLDFEYYGE